MKKLLLISGFITIFNIKSMEEKPQDIKRIISKCQKAIQEHKIDKIEKILSKTTSQMLNEPQAIAKGDIGPIEKINNHKSESKLIDEEQKQLVLAMFQELQAKTALHQQSETWWKKHINKRTVSGGILLALTIAGYFAKSDECTAEMPEWLCETLDYLSTSSGGAGTIYQFFHHFKHTDNKHGLNKSLAFKLQVTDLLRKNGINDTIINQVSLLENQNFEDSNSDQ